MTDVSFASGFTDASDPEFCVVSCDIGGSVKLAAADSGQVSLFAHLTKAKVPLYAVGASDDAVVTASEGDVVELEMKD